MALPAIAHLLLASALASGASAEITLPELPARDNLWETEAFEQTFSESRPSPLPVYDMLNGRTLEERAWGALQVRNSIHWRELDSGTFWKAVDSAADAVETLLDKKQEDPAFRRYAVSIVLAAGLIPGVRRALIVHPLEAGGPARWKRLEELRDRCLKDPDRRLSEFMERNQRDPAGPDLKRVKKESRSLRQRAIKKFQKDREYIKEMWGLCEKIEKNEEEDFKAFLSNKELTYLSKPDQKRLRAAQRELNDYHIYTAYGNLFRRAVAERIGKKAAGRLGVEVLPIKLGWPDFSFLSPGKD